MSLFSPCSIILLSITSIPHSSCFPTILLFGISCLTLFVLSQFSTHISHFLISVTFYQPAVVSLFLSFFLDNTRIFLFLFPRTIPILFLLRLYNQLSLDDSLPFSLFFSRALPSHLSLPCVLLAWSLPHPYIFFFGQPLRPVRRTHPHRLPGLPLRHDAQELGGALLS